MPAYSRLERVSRSCPQCLVHQRSDRDIRVLPTPPADHHTQHPRPEHSERLFRRFTATVRRCSAVIPPLPHHCSASFPPLSSPWFPPFHRCCEVAPPLLQRCSVVSLWFRHCFAIAPPLFQRRSDVPSLFHCCSAALPPLTPPLVPPFFSRDFGCLLPARAAEMVEQAGADRSIGGPNIEERSSRHVPVVSTQTFQIPSKIDACVFTTGACPEKLSQKFGPPTLRSTDCNIAIVQT